MKLIMIFSVLITVQYILIVPNTLTSVRKAAYHMLVAALVYAGLSALHKATADPEAIAFTSLRSFITLASYGLGNLGLIKVFNGFEKRQADGEG